VNEVYTCSESKTAYLGDPKDFAFFKSIKAFQKGTSLQKLSFWLLTQNALHPYHYPLSARVNFFVFQKNQLTKYQFSPGSNSLSALSKLTPIFKSPKFEQTLKIFNRHFPKSIEVDSSLVELTKTEFFKKNQEDYPNLKRGKSFVRIGDIIPRPELRLQRNNITLGQEDFQNRSGPQCNFDLTKYVDGSFIPKENDTYSYVTGIQERELTILMTASFKLGKSDKNLTQNIFSLPNIIQSNNIPYCLSASDQKTILLTSFNTRDAAQIISGLFQYQFFELSTLKQIHQLISFGRHSIFRHPTRVLYESQRGTSDQLEELTQLSVPVYHTDNLGAISGIIRTQQDNHFLLDDRTAIRENCL
jgi:hypothetical protein